MKNLYCFLFIPFICFLISPNLNAQDTTSKKTTVQDEAPKNRNSCVKKWLKRRLLPSSVTSTINKNDFDISFFGNGDIQKSFEKGEKIPANTGLGVSGTRYFACENPSNALGFYKIEFSASINIASNVDTVVAEGLDSTNVVKNSSTFGSSILTPLNSGQAVNLEVSGYFINSLLYGIISGIKLKYIGSNRNWKLNDSSIFQATMNLFRIGLFHDFVPFEYRDKYSAYIGASIAYNSIKGDIGSGKYKEIRRQFLNSERNSFFGYEFSFGFRLRNIKAEFSYPLLRDYGNTGTVVGLTGGRVITTISFVGGFSLKLND